jgi:hypothetical protein
MMMCQAKQGQQVALSASGTCFAEALWEQLTITGNVHQSAMEIVHSHDYEYSHSRIHAIHVKFYPDP